MRRHTTEYETSAQGSGRVVLARLSNIQMKYGLMVPHRVVSYLSLCLHVDGPSAETGMCALITRTKRTEATGEGCG